MSSSRSPLVTLGVLGAFAVALVGANTLADTGGDESAAAEAVAASEAEPGAPAQEPSGATSDPAEPEAAPVEPEAEQAKPEEPVVPARARYTGSEVTGELGVAIGVRRGRVRAYLCDGAAVELWLRGIVDGDRLLAKGDAGSRLDALVEGAGVSGQVRVAGRWRPFTAESDRGRRSLVAAGQSAVGSAPGSGS